MSTQQNSILYLNKSVFFSFKKYALKNVATQVICIFAKFITIHNEQNEISIS